MGTQTFTTNDARSVGEQLGIDWASSPFDVEQFRAGMDVELEHGRRDPDTDVTGDDRFSPARSHSPTCASSATTTRAPLKCRPKAKLPPPGRASPGPPSDSTLRPRARLRAGAVCRLF
jgi:hypothetical protein